MPSLDLIAFDADDTLWHSESLYVNATGQFKSLLARYHSLEWIEQRLYETEIRNLADFGYGVKSFTLSMIETAIELTEGRITGSEIQQIINLARAMLKANIELLPGVAEAIPRLARRWPLMIITKGDLLDQEAKIARSGLAEHFGHVEIVSDKTRASYAALLARHGVKPAGFAMVGNSLRSDIVPVLELSARAVYIPYSLTWAHEVAALPAEQPNGYYQVESIGQLEALIDRW